MLDQPKTPRNFIPDFMDEDALFGYMEDNISDKPSEDPTATSDVTQLPFVQNLIRESKTNINVPLTYTKAFRRSNFEGKIALLYYVLLQISQR